MGCYLFSFSGLTPRGPLEGGPPVSVRGGAVLLGVPWGRLRRLLADRVALGAQQRDRRLEVLEAVEPLVDAREAQVGDLVPCDRIVSSTFCARTARSSSVTGRPWQAFRTPRSTLLRLNGSLAPDRLTTLRLALSSVVKRRPHSGHWRRRRMAVPSSVVRESMTRESVCRQNGQCMSGSFLWLWIKPVSGAEVCAGGRRLG